MSTTRQFDYALGLLKALGYDTGRINGCHVHLGAPTGEDRGTVGEWLDCMDAAECSALIDLLRGEGAAVADGVLAPKGKDPISPALP